MVHEVPAEERVCESCQKGDHADCDGESWSDAIGNWVMCECPDSVHEED